MGSSLPRSQPHPKQRNADKLNGKCSRGTNKGTIPQKFVHIEAITVYFSICYDIICTFVVKNSLYVD